MVCRFRLGAAVLPLVLDQGPDIFSAGGKQVDGVDDAGVFRFMFQAFLALILVFAHHDGPTTGARPLFLFLRAHFPECAEVALSAFTTHVEF